MALTASVFRTTSLNRDNLTPYFLACSRVTVLSPFYPTSDESHVGELWVRRQQLIPKRRCLPMYNASYTRRQQNLCDNHKPRSLHVLKNCASFWDGHLLAAKVQTAWSCNSPCSLVASTGTSLMQISCRRISNDPRLKSYILPVYSFSTTVPWRHTQHQLKTLEYLVNIQAHTNSNFIQL